MKVTGKGVADPSTAGRSRKVGVLAVSVLVLLLVVGVASWRWYLRRLALSARQALATGDLKGAVIASDRWLRFAPRETEARLIKARAAIGAERYQEAYDLLLQAKALGTLKSETKLVIAILAAKSGRLAEAEPILGPAFVRSSRPDPLLDEALARVYLEKYDLKRASTVIERWMIDAPGDAKPYLWRTEIDSRIPDNVGALINDYKEALKRDPRSDKAHLGLAEQYRQAHRNREAAAEFAVYLTQRPDDPAGHLGAGLNAVELGDDVSAIRHFDRVIALQPGNAEAYMKRAEAELRRGSAENALAQIDKAVALDPYNIPIRYSRGLILTRLGRSDDARKEQLAANRLRAEFDRLTSLQSRLVDFPSDPDLQCQVAQWMFDHGQPKAGVRWAEKILKERPDHPGANGQLAEYYKSQGNEGLANYHRLHARPEP